MTTYHRTAALLAAATLALAGCSDDDDPDAAGGTVPESAPYNDADVDFATEMIPHHAQALIMVDMAATRDVSPEFGSLLEQIRAAQAPEIEQMSDWLVEWGEPVPDNARDHGGMGDGSGEDMPGMMDPDDVDDLGSMMGSGFEDRWLTMMIEHHEGAIEMSEEELADGEFDEATDLAGSIVESQTAEIEQMEQMLAG
ncbi:DUF305 domain-containing protein [Nocardioides euryhalodurans]|uniref:DUF305 domain-containing protein n=1 Tax=Nocardioides euryhalodurans TaxID=2518370 RepID=A0A4P7GMQ2_9ACTN|nr:DUF305 domain-containing protein [Nocardioides euryhalodurans]QBR93445.1 DUF305 domain-containing protein [Nocardioides euryhalodurans]